MTSAPPLSRAIGDTHGFAAVIAASEDALRALVRAAWKADWSPDNPGDQGRIPASLTVPTGIVCAGYEVAGGHIEIPQEQLELGLWPEGNGVELKLGLRIRLALHCPPVPSARRFDLQAEVRARVRVEAGGAGRRQLILRLDDVARADVYASLTSGDPLTPRLNGLLTELVAQALTAPGRSQPGLNAPDIPHLDGTFGPTELSWPVGFGTITVTAEGTLALRACANPDDRDSSRHTITARRIGDHVAISLPLTLRISQIRPAIMAQALNLLGPMAIATQLVIAAPLEVSPGRYTARFSAAKVSVGALRPAPGYEGATYARNRLRLPLLGDLIQAHVRAYSEQVAQGLGEISVPTPTVAEIEALIGDLAHQELVGRGPIAVWTADATVGGFSVTSIAVRALPDLLAIGLNGAEGADLGAVTNIIPAGRQFGVAISGPCLQQVIAEARATHGYADADLPAQLTVAGRAVRLTALDVAVMAPAIRMWGSGAVRDPFLRTFIVGARIRADLGLHWEPRRSGSAQSAQAIGARIRGRPAVALKVSVVCWVIVAALALLAVRLAQSAIAFGALRLLGGVLIIGGLLIVWAIGAQLSQRLVARAVTRVLGGIAVCPANLTHIGQARAVFVDPIMVEPSGMILAGDVVPSPSDG